MDKASDLLQEIRISNVVSTKKTKLASTIIVAQGEYPVNHTKIHSTIAKKVGILHDVQISALRSEVLSVVITPTDEILERQGMSQLMIFNVLRLLCLDLNLRVLDLSNEYVPEYR